MEGNPYEIYLLSLNVEYYSVYVVVGMREVIHLVLIVPPQTAKLFVLLSDIVWHTVALKKQ